MHAQAMAFAQVVLGRLDVGRWILDSKQHHGQHVLEIGSRNINGSVRPSLEGLNVRYVGIDLVAGDGVDVVADGATYRPKYAPVLVICTEVFEHSPDGQAIVANAARMLAPGGHLLVTCATDPRTPHSAVDGNEVRPGEFYANVPPGDLYDWVTGEGLAIEKYEIDADCGDLRMLARKP